MKKTKWHLKFELANLEKGLLKMDYVNEFVKKYDLFKDNEIQCIQLKHRYALCNVFGIQEGMRVLEIGCGQGDTTVVLADLVGESGHVVALDIAPGDYGAPWTLQMAHDTIQQSPLGKRISFHLETDFLDFQVDEPFDVVVFSHSSWYFQYEHVLLEYLKRMKEIAKRVCWAEWDLHQTLLSQKAHFYAVSILALRSAFEKNDSNIQRLWSKGRIKKMAESVGWQTQTEQIVDASYLQDGGWEVAYANEVRSQFLNMPAAIQVIVQGYYELMNEEQEVNSLNSFVYVFE
jgi:ubiquinone/menaquinone biosynthesis C-methylase UbiE